jgi:hypothetical protein
LPPAARGALFVKTAPLDPPQKLLHECGFLRIEYVVKEIAGMKTLKLPGGYVDEKGVVHREVELSPLTGKEEELVAQNHRQESASLVTMVLSRCLRRLGSIAPVPADVTGRLPKEDRQFLLLKLREITFGDMVQATVTCPGPDCGNKVDINFSTKDITDKEQVDKEPQIKLELEADCPGCGHEFTIPFDISDFFFRELRTTIDLLYREVHFLAYHYHWSEREILEMSREKRHKYIEILLEEIEKMTDERILPPVDFRPFSRYLYPLEEDHEMEVNGAQDPIGDDDNHEMNYHRKKTQQKDLMKNETPQDSEVQDTEIEENPAEETRKRENIEIPGFSEKSIAFPSLDRENPQSQKPETGDVPSSVGVNLVFTQKKDKLVSTQKKDKIELSDSPPVKDNVTEIETQLPEKIGEIEDGNTAELEKFESPRQEHPIYNTENSGNNLQIPNYKLQRGWHPQPKKNSKSQIPNSKQIQDPELQLNSKTQFTNKSQIPNPELQTNSTPQMLNKSQTLDRENRQSQKAEPVKGKVVETQLPGKQETVKEKSNEIQFPEEIGEIEDSNTVELEKFESSRQEHQPGRAGTKKAILATEAGMLHAPRSPKGHRNSLCDIGIISWNKNKKLKESSTENTELKKNLLSVNSVPSVAKNIIPENGKISAIGNQITNSKSQISNPGLQTNSNPQMLKKSQTSDRKNRQSQKPESGDVPSSVGVNLVFTQKEDKIEFPDSLPVKDNVTEIETQLPEEIKDSNTVELEKIESSEQEHQPGRAGTQKAILATEDTENTEAGGTRSPKGHRNSLSDIGIISWNKNKKLKESSTENTGLEKNLLSVNSVPSVAKNILPENGKISAIGNQITNSKQIQDSELQLNSKTPIPNSEIQIISQPQMSYRSQTSNRNNPQSQKTEVVEDKVIETQLPGRREKSGDYEVRTGESTVKVIPGEKMVSRSNPEAALRIEQLREQVRRLNQSKTLNPEISSFAPSGAEVNREIETEEQEQIPNPPIQPVTMVKRLPTRTKTHQTPCAFWERSYLGRFHLRTLR